MMEKRQSASLVDHNPTRVVPKNQRFFITAYDYRCRPQCERDASASHDA
jgi:hypothetical protein